ncbi:hypothetical protein L6164_027379 [Bauhinia variegata]|uniref:Uncharacterized protein n=1 Tax=Bauhinia variegata TaxID=167791 RepID=A0ACB9LTF3_BAUVA|nr:hypothetical protein L6164_027379 [Bauhinia variegata]
MSHRIYCKRDWKKDARRAHALKIQQVQTPTGEHEAKCLASGIKAEPDRETQTSFSFGEVNIEPPPRVVLSRRDWKAEARKKKS